MKIKDKDLKQAVMDALNVSYVEEASWNPGEYHRSSYSNYDHGIAKETVDTKIEAREYVDLYAPAGLLHIGGDRDDFYDLFFDFDKLIENLKESLNL